MFSMLIKISHLIILIFIVLAPVISWKILQTQNPVINTAVNIVKTCRADDNNPIFLIGDFENDTLKTFHDIRQVILFNDKDDKNFKYHPIFFYKLYIFIISSYSSIHVNNTINLLKNSLWWNHLGYFIILNKYSQSDSCNNASDILLTAWKNDLLNSIFLCSNNKENVIVYAFNPYINWAPKAWNLIDKIEQEKGQFWNLYRQDYKKESVCSNLYFDKTLRLKDYKGIRAVFTMNKLKYDKAKISVNSECSIKRKFDFAMAKLLFDKLEVFPILTRSHQYGTLTRDGDALGVEANLARGIYDILLDFRYLAYSKNSVHSTSALGQSGLSFITYQRGNISIFVEMLHLYSPITALLILTILGLTVIVLKFSVKENLCVAAVDVFRLLFNGSLLKIPNNTSLRIFFATIFIFILITQSILRSKIFSFINAPESDDLDTFSDLNKTNFKIYCMEGFEFLLPQSIQNRCIPVSLTLQQEFLNTSREIAFIWDYYNNADLALKHRMHHSKEMKATLYIAYRIRQNWPLIERIRSIYTRIFESGFTVFHFKWAEINVTYHCIVKQIQFNSPRKALNVEDLTFAFQILIVGLVCAFLSFLIETRYCKN